MAVGRMKLDDRCKLEEVLCGLEGQDALAVVTIPSGNPPPWGVALRLPLLHSCLVYVVRQCTRGSIPDLGVFPELALTSATRLDDFAWKSYELVQNILALLPSFSPERQAALHATALQLIDDERSSHLRLNQAVRGVLFAMVQPDGWIDVGWELPANERKNSSHITILKGHVHGQLVPVVLWDMGLAVNRAAPPDALVKQMRLSIGVPGARKRWQEIWERIAAKEIDVEELRSAHWEALHEGVPPEAIGTFIVDKLDNRRERREEPLPEVERCVDLELLASHLASPEEAAVRHSETEAVRTSLSALSHRQQEIARRYYYGGETDASIGRALGMSQQAVNKQRLAALDKLKELLS